MPWSGSVEPVIAHCNVTCFSRAGFSSLATGIVVDLDVRHHESCQVVGRVNGGLTASRTPPSSVTMTNTGTFRTHMMTR
jgi:hypothetical protein